MQPGTNYSIGKNLNMHQYKKYVDKQKENWINHLGREHSNCELSARTLNGRRAV
jgi:hypothetical protein